MNKFYIVGAVPLAVAVGYALPHYPLNESSLNTHDQRTYRAAVLSDRALIPTAVLETVVSAQPLSRELRNLEEQANVFDTLHLAFKMADSADMATLQRLAGEAIALPDPLYQFNVADIFLEKMTADDPGQALTFAENLPGAELQIRFIASVLTSWARSDEQSVLLYYQSITSIELKQRVAGALLRDRHLSEAFRQTVQDELGPYGEVLARTIRQRSYSAADAFAAALLDDTPASRNNLHISAIRWFRQSPGQALEEVVAMSPSPRRNTLLQGMLQELAKTDPLQALELQALHAPDNEAAEQAILSQYAHQDPAAALPYIEAYAQNTGKTGAMSTLLASWVKLDPQAAVAYAKNLPPHQQAQSLPYMARQYLEVAPREALEWLLSLDHSRNSMAFYALHQLSDKSAEAAESLLVEVSDTEDRGQLIQALSIYKANRDPEQAMVWLEQYQDQPNYQQTYNQTLSRWAENSPREASAQLEQRWYESEMADSFRSVARNWAQRNPDDAIQWASDLPDSPGRNAALATVVETTMTRDPERAQTMYQELPAGKDRDRAGASLAYQLAGGDPEKMRVIMVDLDISERGITKYMLMFEH